MEDKANPDAQAHTVRYYVSDLRKLKQFAKSNNFEPGGILRSCLRAVIEMWDRDGKISIPFVMVDRSAAEKAGLIPPTKRKIDK
jgi:hypothetical protein